MNCCRWSVNRKRPERPITNKEKGRFRLWNLPFLFLYRVLEMAGPAIQNRIKSLKRLFVFFLHVGRNHLACLNNCQAAFFRTFDTAAMAFDMGARFD